MTDKTSLRVKGQLDHRFPQQGIARVLGDPTTRVLGIRSSGEVNRMRAMALLVSFWSPFH